MTERPINFSGPDVRAVLDGRKTQHRIVVRRRDAADPGALPLDYHDGMFWFADGDAMQIPSPHEVGNRLWVREAFEYCNWVGRDLPVPRDDKAPGTVAYRADRDNEGFGLRWRPCIHLPRWASRITLEVTGVRVQRVQDISEEDAIAEGCEPIPMVRIGGANPGTFTSARESFRSRWDSINAKRGAGFYANPWVRAVRFRRVGP